MKAVSVSAYAPGRIELLGNHTDYNEGVVLGAAINRGITAQGTKRPDHMIEIISEQMGSVRIDTLPAEPLTKTKWANYVLGVARELEALGTSPVGFSLRISSDLPVGCGLSSSAALELAAALVLLKLAGRDLPPLEIAKACQRAEHHFVGVKSGLLDQVTSLFGKANHAVFFDARTEEIRTVPLPKGLAVIVAESGRKRELADGAYNLRREETQAAAKALGIRALRDAREEQLRTLPELLRRRATHIVGENARVRRALELLAAADGKGFGKLLNESHRSSQVNFENSVPELDQLVEIAQRIPGVLGARLTGAGFGGATITLCEAARAQAIAAELSARYAALAGSKTQVLVCQIGDGAH